VRRGSRNITLFTGPGAKLPADLELSRGFTRVNADQKDIKPVSLFILICVYPRKSAALYWLFVAERPANLFRASAASGLRG